MIILVLSGLLAGAIHVVSIAAPVAGSGGTPGETFGSLGYVAREQLLGQRLGPTSDLFSLGCVLYEALTGKPALLKATVDDMCAALRRVSVPPGDRVLELTCPPLGRTKRVQVHAVSGQVTPVLVNLDD